MKYIIILLLVTGECYSQSTGGGFPPAANPMSGGSTGQKFMKNSNANNDWAWSTDFGSSSIITVGTIGTGVWQGTLIGSTYGGTGINNAGRTLTINTNSGTINFSGASKTLTVPLDASVSGTNTGDQTTVSGNAGTATALATPRAIYGNNFDGSAALTQIIGSGFGGTGNGFTKFSGAASTEKTYTLPNANATITSRVATAQIASTASATSTTTLFTPPADGFYRVAIYLKITTTGTSPVAGPVTITYTDALGSVAQSHVMLLQSVTGTVVTTTVNNSTTTGTVNGSMVIYAKASVAIQYAIAVSGTFGAGRYQAYLTCEAL